jgi:glycerol dehydrogenase
MAASTMDRTALPVRLDTKGTPPNWAKDLSSDYGIESSSFLSVLGIECSSVLEAAQAIHQGLAVLEGKRRYILGEKWTFSVLASLFLTNQSAETINRVFSFYDSLGLPTRLADIGLGEASDGDLMKAAVAACAQEKPDPLCPEWIFLAIKTADGEGCWRAAF